VHLRPSKRDRRHDTTRLSGPGDDRPPAPVTALTSDERYLQDAVRTFPRDVIAPAAREMDRAASMPRHLIDQLFERGLMGMCVPEDHGGAGGRLMHVVLAVEALSAADPSIGLLVDVQNTLDTNAIIRWGTASQQTRWRQHWPHATSAPTRSAKRAPEVTPSRSSAWRAAWSAAIGWRDASCGLRTPRRRACSSCSPRSIAQWGTAASRRSSSHVRQQA
jgi:hypothetical protein